MSTSKKVSFGEATEAPVEAIVSTPQSEETTVAVQSNYGSNDTEGEIDSSDLRLPRINLVNKTGELGDTFKPGTFVLNKEIALTKEPKETLKVIALRLKKQYQENLPFGSEERPRVYDTKADVEANGGKLTFNKGTDCYAEVAHIEFLIEAPADASEEELAHFTDVVDGKAYARAVYTAASTAYSNAAKPLITARHTHLKDTGLKGGYWELGSKFISGTKFSWWTPSVRSAGRLSASALEEVSSI